MDSIENEEELLALAIKGRGNLDQNTVFAVTVGVCAFLWVVFVIVIDLFIPTVWSLWIGTFMWGVFTFGFYLPNRTIEVPPNKLFVYQDPIFRTLRPVRENLHTLMPFERLAEPNGEIDLRRQDIVRNEAGEFYLTKDEKWVEIDWVVLMSPNPRYPINHIAYDFEKIKGIFRENVTNFLETYCAQFDANEIIGKKDPEKLHKKTQKYSRFEEFSKAFEMQFSGDNTDSFFEIKYGASTKTPQLGQVKVPEEVRDANNAKSVLKSLREAAQELLIGGDKSMSEKDAMFLANAIMNDGPVSMIHFVDAPAGGINLGALGTMQKSVNSKKKEGKDKE